MPPKARGKKDANKDANDGGLAAGQLVQRPATPNDFQIVATVRSLQTLVNTESKWKNRLMEAQHLQQVANTKLGRVQKMMDQCTEGIAQLDSEVQEICDALYVSDHQRPFGPVLTPQLLGTPPAPAATNKAAAAKEKKNALQAQQQQQSQPNEVNLENLPAKVATRRKEEAEHLTVLLKAFYNLPRLAKEEQMFNARPAVSTKEGMLAEMDEAARLSTPTAELLAQAADDNKARGINKLPPKAKTPQPTKGTSKKGSVVGKADGKNNVSLMDPLVGEVSDDELHGELNPKDYLALPVPKGVDARLMNRILTLRSRKLRLAQCMARFKRETIPLRHRTTGVNHMLALGNYSIGAVGPQIHDTMEEEANLQRLRVQEDENWTKQAGAARALASREAPPGPTGTGKK